MEKSMETGPGAVLERLLAAYGEPYTVRRDAEIAGQRLPALARMRIEEERTFLGFSSPRLNMGTSSAGEYVLFLTAETFTEEEFRRAAQLAEAAEETFLDPDESHSFTFFSVVVLADQVLPAAQATLKRYRHEIRMDQGFSLVRIAVVDSARRLYCNRDGKDLGRLVLEKLRQ